MNDTVKLALLRLKMQSTRETPTLPRVDDSGNIKGEVKGFVFLNNNGNVWSEPPFRELIARITKHYDKEAEKMGKRMQPPRSLHGYSGTNYDRPGFQSMLVEIEAGRVGIVITKDLSRLGRNSALTGLYTNFTFPQYGVRYIAINDNYDTIDPNSVNNDFAGIKNWFNEFYARDTSRKIRAVQKAKGERGVPLTVNVPYGYVKDPENPKHWLVDPEAAAIVKRIFSMCMEGRGPTQIANQLWVDKVLTPTAYKLSHGLSTNSPAPEDPYRWDKRAVSLILERLEYTGCTVNFKTYTNSIWDKKRHLNPVENQAIFPDTHERIIDDDVFEKVQEIRSQRHRMTRTGKSSIFSGMVYCADCGSKMQYGSSNHRDFSQDFFDCSLHKKRQRSL